MEICMFMAVPTHLSCGFCVCVCVCVCVYVYLGAGGELHGGHGGVTIERRRLQLLWSRGFLLIPPPLSSRVRACVCVRLSVSVCVLDAAAVV